MTVFTDAKDVFNYIESFLNLEKIKPQKDEYRLDRMKRLCELLRDPWKGRTIIHLAGSKGKGSTASFLENVLFDNGLKTCLYTSPHIIDYSERIRINKKSATDKQLLEAIPVLQGAIERMKDDPPSFFELLTALCFITANQQSCDVLILETGLGGRLDATNVVTPDASVILPIELEHCEYLGNTIKEIAFEKAGIIKNNVPVFVSEQKKDAAEVISKVAISKHATLKSQNFCVQNVRFNEKGLQGSVVKQDRTYKIRLSIPSEIQIYNAELAKQVIEDLYPHIPEQNILQSLEKVTIKGRMDIVSQQPLCVLDGSHTPASVQWAHAGFSALSHALKGEKVLLFACAADKDYKNMLNAIYADFDHIIISKPSDFKLSNPIEVYNWIQNLHQSVILEQTQPKAFEMAKKLADTNGSVLVLGSFFLLSEIYGAFYVT